LFKSDGLFKHSNRQDLEREIQVALAQGYYVAEEDLELGLIRIAAPVRDETGQIIAAFSLVIPSARYTDTYKRQSIELIVDAARRLSKKLGYRDKRDASETIPETVSRSPTKSQAKVADN
jgi:DNA-binding IclR family transcriptional regulator